MKVTVALLAMLATPAAAAAPIPSLFQTKPAVSTIGTTVSVTPMVSSDFMSIMPIMPSMPFMPDYMNYCPEKVVHMSFVQGKANPQKVSYPVYPAACAGLNAEIKLSVDGVTQGSSTPSLPKASTEPYQPTAGCKMPEIVERAQTMDWVEFVPTPRSQACPPKLQCPKTRPNWVEVVHTYDITIYEYPAGCKVPDYMIQSEENFYSPPQAPPQWVADKYETGCNPPLGEKMEFSIYKPVVVKQQMPVCPPPEAFGKPNMNYQPFYEVPCPEVNYKYVPSKSVETYVNETPVYPEECRSYMGGYSGDFYADGTPVGFSRADTLDFEQPTESVYISPDWPAGCNPKVVEMEMPMNNSEEKFVFKTCPPKKECPATFMVQNPVYVSVPIEQVNEVYPPDCVNAPYHPDNPLVKEMMWDMGGMVGGAPPMPAMMPGMSAPKPAMVPGMSAFPMPAGGRRLLQQEPMLFGSPMNMMQTTGFNPTMNIMQSGPDAYPEPYAKPMPGFSSGPGAFPEPFPSFGGSFGDGGMYYNDGGFNPDMYQQPCNPTMVKVDVSVSMPEYVYVDKKVACPAEPVGPWSVPTYATATGGYSSDFDIKYMETSQTSGMFPGAKPTDGASAMPSMNVPLMPATPIAGSSGKPDCSEIGGCDVGFKCVSSPKQCFTTPCHQVDCVYDPNTPKQPPSMTCEQCVGNKDPWCNTNAWDSICKGHATETRSCGELCAKPAVPTTAAPSTAPLVTCESCVAKADLWCGENNWDNACKGIANGKCSLECASKPAPVKPVDVVPTLKPTVPIAPAVTCESCVGKEDPWCGENKWDKTCTNISQNACAKVCAKPATVPAAPVAPAPLAPAAPAADPCVACVNGKDEWCFKNKWDNVCKSFTSGQGACAAKCVAWNGVTP